MENKFLLNLSLLILQMACVPEVMLHSLLVRDIRDMIVEIKSVVKNMPKVLHFSHLIWVPI